MLRKIDTHYFSKPRENVISDLQRANPLYQFRIGERLLGDPSFRSEYSEWEIVSEYRPNIRDRKNRYAIYARESNRTIFRA